MGDQKSSSMMKTIALVTVLLAVAFGDAPAAATLPEMVKLISAGKFANNFFDGDMVQKGANEVQQVGGCLLDKVTAIKNENGLKEFPNDLKVDTAALTQQALAILNPIARKYLSGAKMSPMATDSL